MEKPPRTQQVDEEGQISEMDQSSEGSYCSSCGVYRGMRESESHLEDTNTGSPNRMAQAEENDVWMLYDMFENLLLETKDINLRARAIIDTMTDELKEKGIVRRFMR